MASTVSSPADGPSSRYEDLMERFGVTSNGFLPSSPPLVSLGAPFCEWEKILASLPSLLHAGGIRRLVDIMPTLSVAALQSEPELRRAYVILGFLSHAYIWGNIWNGDKPAQVSSSIPSAASFFSWS